MAVLKHPNLDFDNGTAPNSVAELVAIDDVEVLIIQNGVGTIPHPNPTTLVEAGGGSVGYAS